MYEVVVMDGGAGWNGVECPRWCGNGKSIVFFTSSGHWNECAETEMYEVEE